MNTQPPQRPRADIERETLPGVIAQAKAYDARFKAFSLEGQRRYMSSAEIYAFARELRQWEAYFRQFEPVAEGLVWAGLPALRQWLDWVLKDMPDLQRIYDEMYQKKVASENQLTAMARASDKQIFDILQDVNRMRRK